MARIVPAGEPIAERIEGMIDAGLVAWSGAGLDPAVPVARTRGERSVSEILLEGRD
ncbi:MAG: hypothetical protein GWM92_02570 [Gemmatimonadetes bacterium]|nr:hypothetical protein [Gemmatimonadota bacterium]NIR77388.1 hypothetical protein [Gemmatimonadota bacterium]NIT85898.1 hypothetical protein [Gemmatimonadota bacterium]NIU29724.1 hypothetical protein [Gemmatimonadota bacterium]NIU34766.1 hypothetical protein [Gemmatimonadota bacterium]